METLYYHHNALIRITLCHRLFTGKKEILYYNFRSRNMMEKQVFFWTLSGVVKPFRSIGFRLALAFSLLTPET